MKIVLIAVLDEQGALGSNGTMLWDHKELPRNIKHFREKTLNTVMIMGRKTLASFPGGRPLRGRKRHIVLTRNSAYRTPFSEVTVVTNIDSALIAAREDARDDEEVMVIGGGKVYDLFAPHADYLYLTRVHHTFEVDDDTVFFPIRNFQEWEEVERDDYPSDEKNRWALSFLTLKRIS